MILELGHLQGKEANQSRSKSEKVRQGQQSRSKSDVGIRRGAVVRRV